MYGGHITDAWDRRINNTYLIKLVQPTIMDGSNLMQNFKSPDSGKYE